MSGTLPLKRRSVGPTEDCIDMKRPLLETAFAIIAVALLVSCGPPATPYKLVRLPSGKSVKVLSVGKVYFSKGEPALMLKYETDLPITDVAALEREADELWQSFQHDVENAHLKNAIISASSHPSGGFVSRSQSYNFVFQQSANGLWKRLPNK